MLDRESKVSHKRSLRVEMSRRFCDLFNRMERCTFRHCSSPSQVLLSASFYLPLLLFMDEATTMTTHCLGNCVFVSMALFKFFFLLIRFVHRAGVRWKIYLLLSLPFILHFARDCYYEAINSNKRRKRRESRSK